MKRSEGMTGKKHTDETKRKMSESHTGKKFSDKHRLNMTKSGILHPGNTPLDKHLQRWYGITEDQYNLMLENQNGVCKICQESETLKYMGTLKRLCVDHDHETGKVLGLLCHRCNQLLGLAKDNSNILLTAGQYIRQHQITDYSQLKTSL